MKYEKISLRGGVLTAVLPDNMDTVDPARRRTTVIICPGGAYEFCSAREGEPVALRLAAEDYNAFVLNYSTAPARYPAALEQLAAAVAFVRSHAAEYNVREDAVLVMGFSAGGHLAASLAVRWNEPFLAGALGEDSGLLRPDGLILCYPVITGGPFAHRQSMVNLTGTTDETAHPAQSLETLAGPQVPPTFLWSTWDDASVPVENSLLFAGALRRAGVAAEVHLFAHGTHGSSLATRAVAGPARERGYENADIAVWTDLLLTWLKRF